MTKRVLKILVGLSLLWAASLCCAKNPDPPFHKGWTLTPISRTVLKTAEIAAFMPDSKMLFVVGDANSMEVVDLADASSPVRREEFSLDGEATSVSVFDNLIAVSLLGNPEWGEGFVEIMKYVDGSVQKVVTQKTCFHPDMIVFAPDGKKLLVACEGEPSEDKLKDPFGAVAVINVENLAFSSQDVTDLPVAVLPFDDVSIEPEYITVSEDSRWAWVSLQENNALAKIDLNSNKIAGVFDLGFVDHSKAGFGIDAVKDGVINIKTEKMWGLRQPDGIKTFEASGRHYVMTANEGEDLQNADKVYGLKDVVEKAKKQQVGLKFGSRSVSLFDGDNGKLLWDSGDALEKISAEVAPDYFNWNSKKGKKKVDARSDDKGVEPENIAVGYVTRPTGKQARLAFVGLERMSGIAVFDMTNLNAPALIDFYMDPADRGPEGMLFIDAENSPMPGQALLVVGYEYSKTLVVYLVK